MSAPRRGDAARVLVEACTLVANARPRKHLYGLEPVLSEICKVALEEYERAVALDRARRGRG